MGVFFPSALCCVVSRRAVLRFFLPRLWFRLCFCCLTLSFVLAVANVDQTKTIHHNIVLAARLRTYLFVIESVSVHSHFVIEFTMGPRFPGSHEEVGKAMAPLISCPDFVEYNPLAEVCMDQIKHVFFYGGWVKL